MIFILILQPKMCPIADPGVLSLIWAQTHTFSEIIFYGHSPPSTDSRWDGVSYKLKYGQEVLVNCLVKLSRKKCG